MLFFEYAINNLQLLCKTTCEIQADAVAIFNVWPLKQKQKKSNNNNNNIMSSGNAFTDYIVMRWSLWCHLSAGHCCRIHKIVIYETKQKKNQRKSNQEHQHFAKVCANRNIFSRKMWVKHIIMNWNIKGFSRLFFTHIIRHTETVYSVDLTRNYSVRMREGEREREKREDFDVVAFAAFMCITQRNNWIYTEFMSKSVLCSLTHSYLINQFDQ